MKASRHLLHGITVSIDEIPDDPMSVVVSLTRGGVPEDRFSIEEMGQIMAAAQQMLETYCVDRELRSRGR